MHYTNFIFESNIGNKFVICMGLIRGVQDFTPVCESIHPEAAGVYRILHRFVNQYTLRPQQASGCIDSKT
jgi:hypothetical protein